MPAYDLHYNPPAVIARITLRNASSGVSETGVAALVDSGAEISVLPAAIVAKIWHSASRKYLVSGYDNRTSEIEAASAEIEFGGRSFSGQYLLVEQNIGIIGRDILNLGILVLDGPELQWDFR